MFYLTNLQFAPPPASMLLVLHAIKNNFIRNMLTRKKGVLYKILSKFRLMLLMFK